MKKERKRIQLTSLSLNSGQVEWLPKNPRQWTKEDMSLMMKSLDEDPDFMDDRPPLVIENPNIAGDFVVFGGNLRVEGSKMRKKTKELDCILYVVEDVSVDRDTIIRRAMKDNGSIGDWDMDILANEWDDLPLTDWGVPAWSTGVKDDFRKSIDLSIPHDVMGKKDSEFSAITFVFPAEKKLIVEEWIRNNSKDELAVKIVELCQNAEAR